MKVILDSDVVEFDFFLLNYLGGWRKWLFELFPVLFSFEETGTIIYSKCIENSYLLNHFWIRFR